MGKGHFVIQLPPWAYDEASDLLQRMAFGIHAGGGEVWVKGKPEGTYFTEFLLYTYIVVDGKRIKISMGVPRGRMRRDYILRLCLRTRQKYMEPARAFVQTVLDGIIGETLEYHVEIGTNMVKWRMGDRDGCVSDVFEVVKAVGTDMLGEEQWHVFDFQNRGIGTVLRPGIFNL